MSGWTVKLLRPPGCCREGLLIPWTRLLAPWRAWTARMAAPATALQLGTLLLLCVHRTGHCTAGMVTVYSTPAPCITLHYPTVHQAKFFTSQVRSDQHNTSNTSHIIMFYFFCQSIFIVFHKQKGRHNKCMKPTISKCPMSILRSQPRFTPCRSPGHLQS